MCSYQTPDKTQVLCSIVLTPVQNTTQVGTSSKCREGGKGTKQWEKDEDEMHLAQTKLFLALNTWVGLAVTEVAQTIRLREGFKKKQTSD